MSTEGYSEHTVMGVKVLQSIRQGIASQLWPAAEVLASFTLQVFCPQDENHASTSSDLGVKKVRVMTKEIRESRSVLPIREINTHVTFSIMQYVQYIYVYYCMLIRQCMNIFI